MNKIDKYLRRFAYKIETSETKESRYYTIGDLIVRVSNHIGKNSSGNISIIIDRNNYVLYVPSTNKVSLNSYEECKTLIRGIVLHASLFLVGDSTYQKSLVKENEELKLQISNLKQRINIQERQLIPKKKLKLSMALVNFKRYLTVRFMKFGKIQKFENMLKNLKLI